MSVEWLGTGQGSFSAQDLRVGMRDAVREERPFTAGSPSTFGFPLSGYATPNGYSGGLGQMSEEWSAMVGEADYVIFSYGTPVAWLSAGVWSVPDVTYSQTTSRYVKKVRDAFDVARVKPGT